MKEIVHVRSSAACGTLRDLVLPAERISRDVRPLLAELDRNVRTIAAVTKEMDAENGTGHDTAAAVFVRSLTTLPAANADWEAAQVLAKLFEIDRLLLASYATYPQGRSATVDSLRQRVQNMVDLQRAYTNALRAGPAAQSDNQMDGTANPFAGEASPSPPGILRQFESTTRSDTFVPGKPLTAGSLKFVSSPALVRATAAEEDALVRAVLPVTRECDARR